jgi:hypothetical protein
MKIPVILSLVLFGFVPMNPAQSVDKNIDYVPDVWTRTKSFVKRIDSGNLHGPGYDRYHPPALELGILGWNGRLSVIAELHNLTSTSIKIKGRDLLFPEYRKPSFYPHASVLVSNELDRGWETIGLSPITSGGTDKVISLAPDAVRLHWSVSARRISQCEIELDDFRPLIGKFKYGRVVLDGGGSSQVIALIDLLPEKKTTE